MIRTVAVALVLSAGLAPAQAVAQTAAPPLELGFDAAAVAGPGRRGLGGGPRVVMNFDGRNGLELTATLQQPGPSGFGSFEQQETDHYLAAFKRVVYATGPVRAFATLGGGLERTVIFEPGVGVFPPRTFRLWAPAFTTGGGVDVRLGRHAAIVLESSFILSGQLGGRFSGGLVVPLGAYPTDPGPLSTAVPWNALSEGDRAWVTGGGREVFGEVVRRSTTSLVLRTPAGVETFGPDEITAIDTTDPIRNGMVRGAKIGAAAAVAQAVFASLLFCAMEECSTGQVVALNATLVGIGTGVGAAAGALFDSLRERRAPLYRRRGATTNIAITPLVGKQLIGVGAAIRW